MDSVRSTDLQLLAELYEDDLLAWRIQLKIQSADLRVFISWLGSDMKVLKLHGLVVKRAFAEAWMLH